MKVIFFLSLLTLTSCSTQKQREHDSLMALIESRIELPQGASPLNGYARYYSMDQQGMVVAIYTSLHDLPQNKFYDLPIGRRRWVDDYRALPLISEGGCGVIEITFDPRTQKLDTPACNLRA